MSAFKSDSSGNSSEAVYESYSFINDAKPCKGDSSSPKIVPNVKWWSNHHEHGKCFSHDQLNLLDAEVNLVNTSSIKGYDDENMEKKLIEEYYNTFIKNDASDMSQKQFFTDRTVSRDCSLRELEFMNDSVLSQLMDVEMSKKLSSDLDSDWIELNKIQPWWQSADKDDIRSKVSQRSVHRISNSDPFGSEAKFMEKISDDYITRFDQVKLLDIDQEMSISHGDLATNPDMNISYTDNSSQENPTLLSKPVDDKQGNHQDPRETSSGSNNVNAAKVISPSSDYEPASGGNLSRAQLLEALCHSQTRAREAEKLAQEACDDKDHMLNLFFQQASWLFAYHQWLHLLQLETICLHLRNKDQAKSLSIPSVSYWPGNKGTIIRKNHSNAPRKNNERLKCSVRKCAIVFAVGVSLASAGFLVGWTIGWFFPAF